MDYGRNILALIYFLGVLISFSLVMVNLFSSHKHTVAHPKPKCRPTGTAPLPVGTFNPIKHGKDPLTINKGTITGLYVITDKGIIIFSIGARDPLASPVAEGSCIITKIDNCSRIYEKHTDYIYRVWVDNDNFTEIINCPVQVKYMKGE